MNKIDRITLRGFKSIRKLAAAQLIGIPAMRTACPNFDAWLNSIEHSMPGKGYY